MTISKSVLFVVLALVLISGVSIYFGYQNYTAAQLLEENTEYQAVVAIEAQHPEIYVVAVKEANNHILAYIIVPPQDPSEAEDYTEVVLVDILTVLYAVYPDADAYHILPVEISEVETFEGVGHLGISSIGFGFTNAAAKVLVSTECTQCLLNTLVNAGEIGTYHPRQAGLHLIQEATPRPPGHIPPWASAE